MRNRLLPFLLLPIGLLGFALQSGAQPPGVPESEREQLQRDLEQAQNQLEEAAREIARISAQFTADTMGNVAQRFRFAGQRVMLGLNVEDDDRGVRVAGVSPNGPAAAAGIRAGDVILTIDGATLAAGGNQSPSQLLFAQMANVEPGESVTLSIARGDEEMDLTVVAREFDPGEIFSRWSDFDLSFPGDGNGNRRAFRLGRFGPLHAWRSMELVQLTPELGSYFGTERGLLVVRAPESNDLGLRDGDVILDIGGREPTTPERAMRILASYAPGETLRVTVMRQRQRQSLELELPVEAEGAESEENGQNSEGGETGERERDNTAA